jgi:ATP-dependent Lhr-like helicase
MRAVLIGEYPSVALSQRASAALARLRDERSATVHPNGTVLVRQGEASRWWTYAGQRANTSLAASLAADGLDAIPDSLGIRIEGTHRGAEVRSAIVAHAGIPAQVSAQALDGLKFSAALPVDLATAVLAGRIGDPVTASRVADAPITTLVPG